MQFRTVEARRVIEEAPQGCPDTWSPQYPFKAMCASSAGAVSSLNVRWERRRSKTPLSRDFSALPDLSQVCIDGFIDVDLPNDTTLVIDYG